MDPCWACQRLSNLAWISLSYNPASIVEHHKSYKDLRESVDNGCELCSFLWRDLLEEVQRNLLDNYDTPSPTVITADAFLWVEDEKPSNEFVLQPYNWSRFSPSQIEGFYFQRRSWDWNADIEPPKCCIQIMTANGKSCLKIQT